MIFINFRVEDSGDLVHRIYEDLVIEFDKAAIFLAPASLKAGAPWTEDLEREATSRAVMLVCIGKRWEEEWYKEYEYEPGKWAPRFSDPHDWVRKEIELAFASQKTVVPLLLNRTEMPSDARLDLVRLPMLRGRQRVRVHGDGRYFDEFGELVKELQGIFASLKEKGAPSTAKQTREAGEPGSPEAGRGRGAGRHWSQLRFGSKSWRVVASGDGIVLQGATDTDTDTDTAAPARPGVPVALSPQGDAAAWLADGKLAVAWLRRSSGRVDHWPRPMVEIPEDANILALDTDRSDGVRLIVSDLAETFVVRARCGGKSELSSLEIGPSRAAVFINGKHCTVDASGRLREPWLTNVLGSDEILCLDAAGGFHPIIAAVRRGTGGYELLITDREALLVTERLEDAPVDVVVERAEDPRRVLLDRGDRVTSHSWVPVAKPRR